MLANTYQLWVISSSLLFFCYVSMGPEAPYLQMSDAAEGPKAIARYFDTLRQHQLGPPDVQDPRTQLTGCASQHPSWIQVADEGQ
jgi:hypothetical protein